MICRPYYIMSVKFCYCKYSGDRGAQILPSRTAFCSALLYTNQLWFKEPYLLTPWSRVLLEKLTSDFAASQEISRIYGTRKSLTVPTSARHLSV
jgi:hypothetical protein